MFSLLMIHLIRLTVVLRGITKFTVTVGADLKRKHRKWKKKKKKKKVYCENATKSFPEIRRRRGENSQVPLAQQPTQIRSNVHISNLQGKRWLSNTVGFCQSKSKIVRQVVSVECHNTGMILTLRHGIMHAHAGFLPVS